MRVSIIVPVLNEAPIIAGFLQRLRAVAPDAEIIVADGESRDGTAELCRHIADYVVTTQAGRAKQMNAGAKIASGEIFWFVHADSQIATNSIAAIEFALRNPAVVGGCFRLEIIPRRWIYRIRDRIGNFCVGLFRLALGDRGLFCRRKDFLAIGGYPDHRVLEDAEFYRKLRRLGRVKQIPVKIQTSARRYETLGPARTILFYLFIMVLYLARMPMARLEAMVTRFAASRPALQGTNKRFSSDVSERELGRSHARVIIPPISRSL